MYVFIYLILLHTVLQSSHFQNCKTSNYETNFLLSIERFNELLVSKFPSRTTSTDSVFVSSSFLFYEQLLLILVPSEGESQIQSVSNFLQIPHDPNGIDCYTDGALYFRDHIKQQKISHKGLVYINPNVDPNQLEKDKTYHINPKKIELFNKIATTTECDLSEKKTELEDIIKLKTHNMLSIETIEGMVTKRTFSIYIMLLGMHFTLNQYPETPVFKPISVIYEQGSSDGSNKTEKVERDVLEANDEFYTYTDDQFFVVFVDIYIKATGISVNEKTKMIFVAKHENLTDHSKENFLQHLGQLDFKSIYKLCKDSSNKQCEKKKMNLRIPIINELYVKDFYNKIMVDSGMKSLFNGYLFKNYVQNRPIDLISDGVGIITKMFLNKEGESKIALLSMEASDFKLEEVIPNGYAHSMFVSLYDTELGISYLDLLMYKDHNLKGPRLILDSNQTYGDRIRKNKHLLFLLVIGFITFVLIICLILKKKGTDTRKIMRNKLNERKSLLVSDRNEDVFV